MATVRVKFEDGSRVVLNNVPDNISSDDFLANMKKAYPLKKVVSIEKLKNPEAGNEPFKAPAYPPGNWKEIGNGYIMNTDTEEIRLRP